MIFHHLPTWLVVAGAIARIEKPVFRYEVLVEQLNESSAFNNIPPSRLNVTVVGISHLAYNVHPYNGRASTFLVNASSANQPANTFGAFVGSGNAAA